ncbi:T9SS type A sorting domain-containing protein [Paracrocinitomix mangrovi]|uniref:T9SS type A sorting domain-containing protein n=1 Tax=Paracrocinitomix mangrovi TaxID=2862509 RepID=UPI001C8E7BD6|nr:T9SS type A sorting domain-containing protein [Paracrocinitomix mangrovi]UKN02627.1 T9SS type A sorting domain-containing protein [Paracrocinitomix mangrovi]
MKVLTLLFLVSISISPLFASNGVENDAPCDVPDLFFTDTTYDIQNGNLVYTVNMTINGDPFWCTYDPSTGNTTSNLPWYQYMVGSGGYADAVLVYNIVSAVGCEGVRDSLYFIEPQGDPISQQGDDDVVIFDPTGDPIGGGDDPYDPIDDPISRPGDDNGGGGDDGDDDPPGGDDDDNGNDDPGNGSGDDNPPGGDDDDDNGNDDPGNGGGCGNGDDGPHGGSNGNNGNGNGNGGNCGGNNGNGNNGGSGGCGGNDNGNNGHGNNEDGVDSSNPGNGNGGPNGDDDLSGNIDDENGNNGGNGGSGGNGMVQPLMPPVVDVDDFKLYPNPAVEKIFVNYSLKTDEQNVIFQLVDKNGSIQLTRSIYMDQQEINVDSVNNGVYYYYVYSSGSLVKSGKLMIN